VSDDRERRNGEPEVEWSAAERAALERLRAGGPPPDLEESVVAALAGEGLVADMAAGSGGSVAAKRPHEPPGRPARVPTRRAWAWGALALVATLAAFFAGVSISDRGAGSEDALPGTVGPASPERWLLLLYEDAAYRAPATPEETAARVAEYVAWVEDLLEQGVAVDGEELAGPVESEMLDGRRGAIETGPGAPSGPVGTVAGYFVVEAPDREAAIAIARTSPHLAHGGTVVVRRIVRH
jgi:hypothetical protein